MPSSATVTEYLAQLPADRRKEISRVRSVVRKHLPAGYREVMCAGMITYEVPLKTYPDTYNGHALWYVALGAQKHYLTLYLMNTYGSAALNTKLKNGFKAAEDLALQTVGEVVASTSLEQFVTMAKAARRK